MKDLTQFSRSELILGYESTENLNQKHVAVFGIGGVGGSCVEGLARAGIGTFSLFDNDNVSLTNINRQIIATHSSIGKPKVEVMKARILDINPNAKVLTYPVFFMPDNSDDFDFSVFDYVVDAIDTVEGKFEIIKKAKAQKTPVISSMGTGNKLHPELFEIADIKKTSVCPLARVMRKKLKDFGINDLKVLYSKELPQKPLESKEIKGTAKRPVPGSLPFVPPVAGLIIAGEVIRDLCHKV